jgi:hypothetical protein
MADGDAVAEGFAHLGLNGEAVPLLVAVPNLHVPPVAAPNPEGHTAAVAEYGNVAPGSVVAPGELVFGTVPVVTPAAPVVSPVTATQAFRDAGAAFASRPV